MKKLLRVLSRLILIVPAVAVQVVLYTLNFYWLRDYILYLFAVSVAYQIVAIIYILNKNESTKLLSVALTCASSSRAFPIKKSPMPSP